MNVARCSCKDSITVSPSIRGRIPTNSAKILQQPLFLQPTMKYEKALELLKKYKGKTFNASNVTVDMEINGNKVVGEWLGGGGSKSAYLANINGEDVCILLPNKIYSWEFALKEPQNTILLKKMGLLTNDYCKIVPVTVEGHTLPAIISKPYNNHSFRIFDKKNPNDNMEKYVNVNDINSENFLDFIKTLLNDVKNMTQKRVKLSYDSYNIALVDGKPRLYFNDLPYESEQMFDNDMEYTKLLKYNLKYAINALTGSFSMKARRSNQFLESISSIDGENIMVENLLSIIQ